MCMTAFAVLQYRQDVSDGVHQYIGKCATLSDTKTDERQVASNTRGKPTNG